MESREIRFVTENDSRDEISRIYEESWKSAYKDIIPGAYLDSIPKGAWASSLDSPGRRNLVLTENGRITGTCSFGASRFPEREGFGEIVAIYLLPESMGKGYGKALFKRAVEELKKEGYQNIFLWVLEENRHAGDFYEKMGFQKKEIYLDDNIGGRDLREIQYVYSL